MTNTIKGMVYGVLSAVLALALPVHAGAQEPKVRVSFGSGVASGPGSSDAAFRGSVGYSFSPRLSFDLELARIGDTPGRMAVQPLAFASLTRGGTARGGRGVGDVRAGGMPAPPSEVFRGIGAPVGLRLGEDGSTMLATAGFRYLVPAGGGRLRPYVSGGFGMSRTEDTFRVLTAAAAAPNARPGTPMPTMLDGDESRSHMGLVGSGGLGASLRLIRELWLDVDARYYRVDRGRSVGTFGGGVSYRF